MIQFEIEIGIHHVGEKNFNILSHAFIFNGISLKFTQEE